MKIDCNIYSKSKSWTLISTSLLETKRIIDHNQLFKGKLHVSEQFAGITKKGWDDEKWWTLCRNREQNKHNSSETFGIVDIVVEIVNSEVRIVRARNGEKMQKRPESWIVKRVGFWEELRFVFSKKMENTLHFQRRGKKTILSERLFPSCTMQLMWKIIFQNNEIAIGFFFLRLIYQLKWKLFIM